jgi:hypothetical protein
MKSYYENAVRSYACNLEALLVIMLTALELWIVCDKSATQIHTVLSDYDACILMEMFKSLLLLF